MGTKSIDLDKVIFKKSFRLCGIVPPLSISLPQNLHHLNWLVPFWLHLDFQSAAKQRNVKLISFQTNYIC